MYHLAFHKIIPSHKGSDFLHISFFQFFSDIGTADLPVSIHFFGKDFHIKAILFSKFHKKPGRTLPLEAKPVVLSHYYVGCPKISHKNLFYKILSLHMPDSVI